MRSIQSAFDELLVSTEKGRPYLDLAFCLLCAVLSLSVFFVVGATPDARRFTSQAESILGGEGYRTNGELETWLPPGYPVFLVLLKAAGLGEYVRGFQILLHCLSIVLIYFTAYRYSRKSAFIVTAIFALSPLPARMTGYLLSEAFGVFLCAALCFLVSRITDSRNWVPALLLGAVLTALVLTSPATIFLCTGLGLLVLVRLASSRAAIAAAALIVGAFAPMIPWQSHCLNATGSLCYLVYTKNPISVIGAPENDANLVYRWYRTWSLGERHIHVLHRKNPGGAPEWAFRNAEDRENFPAADVRLRGGLTEKQKEVIEGDLKQKQGFPRMVAFSLLRAFTLWFDMPQLGHAQLGYVLPFGIAKAIEATSAKNAAGRVAKSTFSTVVFVLYIMIPVLFVLSVYSAYRRGPQLVIAISVSIVLYTAISAFAAHNESRRNVVFFPAMLLVIGLALPPITARPSRSGSMIR